MAIAGGGLSAMGGMAQQRAANREARLNSWANVQKMEQDTAEAVLRNKILNQYVGRQNGFVGQNQAALGETMSSFSPEAQAANQAGAEAKRGAAITAAIGDGPRTEVATAESASPLVQGELAKRLGEAFGQVQQQGAAQAKLGSFGDAWGNNGESMQNSARKIDTTNNFARGDIAMLPYDQDLQAFQTRKPIVIPGANPKNPGSALQGLGSLVGSLAGAYGGKMSNSIGGWSGIGKMFGGA